MYKGGVNNRRASALKRLENQLKLGVKQPKKTDLTMDMIPLSEDDKTRIKKEIETLKSRT